MYDQDQLGSPFVSSYKSVKQKYRIAVSVYFFLEGLCFASWASRIPDIQLKLNLSESALGLVILAIPIGLLVSLPFSGFFVYKLGSRRIMTLGLLLYGLILISIGYVETKLHLIICLFLFGFSGNLSNIASNTQAVAVEGLYRRSIMASFHGIWSLAGFISALTGSIMIGNGVVPFYHFIVIALVMIVFIMASYPNSIKTENKKKHSEKLFTMPEKVLVRLGVIAFCSMLCEGAMFDWSGIYFHKVVMTDDAMRSAGYMAFMGTMALGRFVADAFTNKFGLNKTLKVSGVLISLGLIVSIVFPFFIPAVIGFLLVGFGVSSVIPLVYSAAGNSKVLEVSIAISAVSTLGFLGFLIGPPLIGFVAGTFSLRVSFLIIALTGSIIFLLAGFKREPKLEIND
jgi:MFS family permease